METRVAAISIIVENPESVEKLNALLHEAGKYIIGRMGVPYREKGISIIMIARYKSDLVFQVCQTVIYRGSRKE